MIVEENGKLYEIDEATGLVTMAKVADVDQAEAIANELRINDRVEVDGQIGNIISITASLYGPAFGVRFDDGSIDEFAETHLRRSAIEKAASFASPVEEVQARFTEYEQLPAITTEELGEKEREARWLQLKAKSLVSDQKLSAADQSELGRIVLVTGADLEQIAELQTQSAQAEDYLGGFNRYRIASEVSGYGAGLGMKGDASWLENVMDDMEVVETTDTDLAARATEVVAALTDEQLEDDAFLTVAASYQRDYLQMDDAQVKKFASYLERARKDRQANPAQKVAKQAAADDLNDVDDAALFL